METGTVCYKASVFHFAALEEAGGGGGRAEIYKGQMMFRQGEIFQLPWCLAQTGATLASLSPAFALMGDSLRSTRPFLGMLCFGEDSMSGLHSPSSHPSWMEGSTGILHGVGESNPCPELITQLSCLPSELPALQQPGSLEGHPVLILSQCPDSTHCDITREPT